MRNEKQPRPDDVPLSTEDQDCASSAAVAARSGGGRSSRWPGWRRRRSRPRVAALARSPDRSRRRTWPTTSCRPTRSSSPSGSRRSSPRASRPSTSGTDLETIAMPVGGICAGQIYLAGDGRLVHWDIFNQHNFTGYGRDNYRTRPQARRRRWRRASPFGSQTAARRSSADAGRRRLSRRAVLRRVSDRHGRVSTTTTLPVAVTLEAFSPFIPLERRRLGPAGHRDAVHA